MDYVTMLREYRIGPFTIFDTVLAYLGILIISPLLIKLFSLVRLKITLASWLWLTMPLSVIFHLVFSQDTPLIKVLLNSNNSYIALAVLLFMTFMGLKDIRRI